MDETRISLFFTEFFSVLFERLIITTVAECDPKTVSIYNIYLYSSYLALFKGQMQLSLSFHHPLIKFILKDKFIRVPFQRAQLRPLLSHTLIALMVVRWLFP
ncbi:hypothetical protein C8R45DRAFT_1078223 [Mycena sanguinolenta]|nr:hypothetical protein C8R45DRAFT_1078223 [Mycena sanguinolenta]